MDLIRIKIYHKISNKHKVKNCHYNNFLHSLIINNKINDYYYINLLANIIISKFNFSKFLHIHKN